MFTDTVTQTKFGVKPARVVRCKVLDAVCVLPFNVFRELDSASNAVEQARDEFVNACQSADARAITQTFEILQSTIIASHTQQLQAVRNYGVEAASGKMITDIKEFCKVRDAGEIAEIDEEMFYYFLEVIPPVAMNTAIKMPDGRTQPTAFLFAEGREEITAFWSQGKGEEKRYFAQLTNILNPNW